MNNREGEVDGVHYHFVDMAEMESAVERGEFLEHARVHTNMYGTSAKSVREVRDDLWEYKNILFLRRIISLKYWALFHDLEMLTATHGCLDILLIDLNLSHSIIC